MNRILPTARNFIIDADELCLHVNAVPVYVQHEWKGCNATVLAEENAIWDVPIHYPISTGVLPGHDHYSWNLGGPPLSRGE